MSLRAAVLAKGLPFPPSVRDFSKMLNFTMLHCPWSWIGTSDYTNEHGVSYIVLAINNSSYLALLAVEGFDGSINENLSETSKK